MQIIAVIHLVSFDFLASVIHCFFLGFFLDLEMFIDPSYSLPAFQLSCTKTAHALVQVLLQGIQGLQ